MSTINSAVQVVSISTALFCGGLNLGLNVFNIPGWQAQPASRSLPSIRWVFSRGSHTFPQACFVSAAGFSYLAYAALPAGQQSIAQLLKLTVNGSKVNLYLVAAVLAITSAPWTRFMMIPTNFELIKMNEELGGFRSSAAAKDNADKAKSGSRSANDSVDGKSEGAEFTDLSNPQSKTLSDSTPAQDKKVNELLDKFAKLNWVRIWSLAASGVLGLVIALP